jgi:hypothetical protein
MHAWLDCLCRQLNSPVGMLTCGTAQPLQANARSMAWPSQPCTAGRHCWQHAGAHVFAASAAMRRASGATHGWAAADVHLLVDWLGAGGTGEYTDYYLYITTLQDEHCQSGAVAWALPCLYDLDSNRPLLGAANLCPEMFAKTSQDAAVSVLVHELLHALVSQGRDRERGGQGDVRCGWVCVRAATQGSYPRVTRLADTSICQAALPRHQQGCTAAPPYA